jgi:hypothetical protein
MTIQRISKGLRAAAALAWPLAFTSASASAASAPDWLVQRLPVPSSAVTSPLSCSSSTACTAVAAYYPFPASDNDVLLAVRWGGRGWARQVMPEPAGSSTVLVSGISCPSGSWCVAVGGSTSGDPPGAYVPIVERWNGAVWSLERVPAPARPGLSSRLTSVSCTSPIACTAVGQSVSRNPRRRAAPLAERWNGTTWSIQHAIGGPLTGVSCASRLACTAVGDTADQGFAEGWEGSGWSIEPNPHPRGFGGPDGDNELDSVSCASRDACIAVGDTSWETVLNSVRITLAERWNGSRWSVQPSPNPIQLDDLTGVSCWSSSSCIAVGDYTNRAGTATLPLVERWRGGRWSMLQAPRRLSTGKSADSTLLAVDCFGNGGCVALGDAEGGPFSVQFAATGS